MAATGVGAGDLVTGALAGSELGTTLLWAAVLGALLKGVLNEGLARWQLATGETLLEAWVGRLGRPVGALFLAYLLLWSVVVGGALVNACGIAGAALLPLGGPVSDRVVWGVVHALGGLALVRAGGFRRFETIMAASVALMFACVLVTAARLLPAPGLLLHDLLVPRVPAGGLAWSLGVLGGVGGTVTLLSYGYWIREHGRRGPEGVRACRVDLAVAYGLTGLFGAAMIVIGARLRLEGSGAGVALALADQLAAVLGPPGRWIFLVGFWGAVTSSLLGVWQGVPYLFADVLARLRHEHPEPDGLAARPAYRWFQVGLAVVPLVLLGGSFRVVQLAYAVLGALFMPCLAATLLVLGNRRDWIGRPLANHWLANLGLVAVLVLFAWQGGRGLLAALGG